MLSIGWTEMLIVAAVALIVVGPRDLPAMLRQLGKAVGTVRKMGNEFRSELNKVTALDDVRDIRKSITNPIQKVTSEIRSEFNKVSADGKVSPTGKLAPRDPSSESVFDEINAAAGKPIAPPDPDALKNNMAAAIKRSTAAREEELAAKAAAAQAETAKAAPKKAAAKKPAARKSATKPAAPAKAASKAPAKKAAPKTAPAKTAPKRTASKRPASAAATPKGKA